MRPIETASRTFIALRKQGLIELSGARHAILPDFAPVEDAGEAA